MSENNNVTERLLNIMSQFDDEYFVRCENDMKFPIEVFDKFKENKFMTLFLTEELGGKGLSLSKYHEFQEILCKYSINVGFIYNQHVAFLKYLTSFNDIPKDILEDIIKEQILCGIGLSEINGVAFQSKTEFSEKIITKKAVTSCDYAKYTLVNTLQDGQEVFNIMPRSSIVESSNYFYDSLNASNTKLCKYDIELSISSVLDIGQNFLKTNIFPWASVFAITALNATITYINNELKEMINYTFIEQKQMYVYENEAIRTLYMELNYKKEVINLLHNNTDFGDIVDILKTRVKVTIEFRDYLAKYEKFQSMKTFLKNSTINLKINEARGISYLSPSVFEINTILSNMEFNIIK